MATRVGVGYISMIRLNCATLKPPVWSKNLGHIYYTGREMAHFVLQLATFRYHGNKGKSKVNFRDTVKLRDLENPLFRARISAISLINVKNCSLYTR